MKHIIVIVLIANSPIHYIEKDNKFLIKGASYQSAELLLK